MADGKTVAVVGVGPVGLAAILGARAMYQPKAVIAIDLNKDRLALARDMGATHTIQISFDKGPGCCSVVAVHHATSGDHVSPGRKSDVGSSVDAAAGAVGVRTAVLDLLGA